MDKHEIELLLTNNGYVKHSIYGFFHIPKKNLGHYFYNNEGILTIGKIKWGTINIKEVKTVSLRSFNPHNYGLVTDLDRKQAQLTQQRMVKNRNKQKELLKKGFQELPTEEPLPPVE